MQDYNVYNIDTGFLAGRDQQKAIEKYVYISTSSDSRSKVKLRQDRKVPDGFI